FVGSLSDPNQTFLFWRSRSRNEKYPLASDGRPFSDGGAPEPATRLSKSPIPAILDVPGGSLGGRILRTPGIAVTACMIGLAGEASVAQDRDELLVRTESGPVQQRRRSFPRNSLCRPPGPRQSLAPPAAG